MVIFNLEQVSIKRESRHHVADSYAKIASCLEKSAAQETERDV
ncbi:unnamed protein product [Toxocara canis]|uniref:Transposase n=1 Tax=Toxocara canis TaxID=6265 RepID=A0A183U967_TOXCA|nr:unnamed protein product [Toxocara canis]